MGFLQGLTASKSVRKPRTFGAVNLKVVPLMNVNKKVKARLSNDGRKSKKELPALALSGGPSPVFHHFLRSNPLRSTAFLFVPFRSLSRETLPSAR